LARSSPRVCRTGRPPPATRTAADQSYMPQTRLPEATR
jgi:hypothetical protein